MTFISQTITLADVRAALPKKIYYSTQTCWWTHDARHLCRHASGLPCDPRGGMLFEAHDTEAFLQTAEEHPEHYGRHGLDAFMAAHHLNCHVSETDARCTCMASWADYNDAIDARKAGQ